MRALWGGGRGIHFEGATPAKRHQFRMKLLRVKLRVCRWHGLCGAKGSSSPPAGIWLAWPGGPGRGAQTLVPKMGHWLPQPVADSCALQAGETPIPPSQTWGFGVPGLALERLGQR